MQLLHDDPVTLTIIGIGLLITAFVVWHYLTSERRTCRFREKIYRGLDVSDHPRTGDVHVVFHTYSGVLVYLAEETHDVWLPPDQAKTLLWRLHGSNLIRCLFSHGVLLVPVVSFCNYVIQMVRVHRQRRQLIAHEKAELAEL